MSWHCTEIAEAVDVAREHLAWCRRNRGVGQYESARSIVHDIGRDMRPCCNGHGTAIAIAIIAAEWLQLRKNND